MNDDEDLEERLGRWRPAEAPPDLLRRLQALEPPTRARHPWRSMIDWLRAAPPPWRLAYAGLLAAWALIFALRLTTPFSPEPPGRAAIAQADAVPANAPVLVSTLAREYTFFLARNPSDQP